MTIPAGREGAMAAAEAAAAIICRLRDGQHSDAVEMLEVF